MNKIIVIIVLCIVVFSIGFKLGDAHGYNDGYREGYSYDCQAEITDLKSVYESLQKAVSIQRKITSQVQNRLDSVAYHEKYHVRDSLRSVQFSRDSVKNWKSAKSFNDSIDAIGDGKYRAHKRADGSKVPHEELFEFMENNK